MALLYISFDKIQKPEYLQGICNYDPNSEKNQGVSKYALCKLIGHMTDGIRNKIKEIDGRSEHDEDIKKFQNECHELLIFIADSPGSYIGLDQQPQCEEIYYKICDLVDSAKKLDHLDYGSDTLHLRFNPSDIVTELKRLYYTEAATFMTNAAINKINNDERKQVGLPSDGYSKTVTANLGGGAKAGINDSVGASITAGASGGHTTANTIRGDDQTYVATQAINAGLYANMKLGVTGTGAPITLPNSEITIAGATTGVTLGVTAKDGIQCLAKNRKIVQLQQFISNGNLSDPNVTKSNRLLNWMREVYYAKESKDVGLSAFFQNWTAKEKGSITGFFNAFEGCGISTRNMVEDYSKFNESFAKEEEQKKIAQTYDEYIDSTRNLPPSNTIATLSGTTLSGSATVAAGFAGNFAQGKLQIYRENNYWSQFSLHNTDIDIAKEAKAYTPLMEEKSEPYQKKMRSLEDLDFLKSSKDFSENNIRELIIDQTKTQLTELATALPSITSNILRLNSRAGDKRRTKEDLDHLWSYLGRENLISNSQLNNEELKALALKDPDNLKLIIANGVLAQHLAIYQSIENQIDIEADNNPEASDPERIAQLKKAANKSLSASFCFFLDQIWTGKTSAHLGARQNYRELMMSLGPDKEDYWQNDQTTITAQTSFGAPPFAPVDDRNVKHKLVAISGEVKVNIESTKNHPNTLRNKDEVTITLTAAGLIPTLVKLIHDQGVELLNARDQVLAHSENIPAETLKKFLIDKIPNAPTTPAFWNGLANAVMNLNALVSNDTMTTSKNILVPNFTTNPALGGAGALTINYNKSTGEIEFAGLTVKNTLGMGFTTASIPQPLPAVIDIGFSYSATDTLATHYYPMGTYALIGFAINTLGVHQIKRETDGDKNLVETNFQDFCAQVVRDGRINSMNGYASKILDIKDNSQNDNSSKFDKMKEICGSEKVVNDFIKIFNESAVNVGVAENYASAIAKLQAARPGPDLPEADAIETAKTAYTHLTIEEKAALKLVMDTWSKAIPAYKDVNDKTAEKIKLTYAPRTRYTNLLQQLSRN